MTSTSSTQSGKWHEQASSSVQQCFIFDDVIRVRPTSDHKLDYPVHQELHMRNGIFMIENLDLRGLAAERVYEFLFIFTPTPFKGASGLPGRPIAIK